MKLFLLLLISAQTFAQLEVKDYSIMVNDNRYDFTLMSDGKNSKTKIMKVLTCDKNDFEELKDNIKECYVKYKIEFTDFYILPIDKTNTEDNKSTIVESYLSKIDEIRMAENLSTIRIRFTELYDKSTRSWQINYDLKSKLKINEIDNFHQAVIPANVCYLISGRE